MLLNDAIQLAAKAHDGQVDKGGNPYILHPLRVMLSCENDSDRICAVLHDVVEDTGISLLQLADMGYPDEVLHALECLTKREGEGYDAFINRILPNNTACRVKLADLRDNMDLSRIDNPTPADLLRLDRYRRAEKQILDVVGSSAQKSL